MGKELSESRARGWTRQEVEFTQFLTRQSSLLCRCNSWASEECITYGFELKLSRIVLLSPRLYVWFG